MRLACQPPLMAVCWEQEQPDGKAVMSSTSEVVSETTLNPKVMQIPPAPEECRYRNVARALVGVGHSETEPARRQYTGMGCGIRDRTQSS